MLPIHTLDYNHVTGVFALTTTERTPSGDIVEHVELFTVPANARTFNVLGVDCAALRDTYTMCQAA